MMVKLMMTVRTKRTITLLVMKLMMTTITRPEGMIVSAADSKAAVDWRRHHHQDLLHQQGW